MAPDRAKDSKPPGEMMRRNNLLAFAFKHDVRSAKCARRQARRAYRSLTPHLHAPCALTHPPHAGQWAHETRAHGKTPHRSSPRKGHARSRGRAGVVLGDQLYGAYGELPVLPTVWVLDDTLAATCGRPDRRFSTRRVRRAATVDERWTCPHCARECSKDSLPDCWKCGAPRPPRRPEVSRGSKNIAALDTAAATRSSSLIPSRHAAASTGR